MFRGTTWHRYLAEVPGLIRAPGAFAIYVLVSSITPGPNNVMLAAVGVAKGHRAALRTGAGVSVGWALQIAVCGFGLVALVRAVPFLSVVIEAMAIAYLLWLALRLWRSDQIGTATPMLGFWGAIAFQWANPKALSMALTTAGLFVVHSGGGIHIWSVMAVALVAMALNYPCVCAWGLGGASMEHRLARPGAVRRFNRASAIVLVGLVIWLVAG